MATTTPTPRDILTSLISSLPSIPIADDATTTASFHRPSNKHVGGNAPTNPFKRIPSAYRPILTTLHVLYPSTLLPALDLLDRRLVTRVILQQEDADSHLTNVRDATIPSAQKPPADSRIHEGTKPAPLYHLVRSAEPQSHRRQHATSSGGRVYIVRLESWNCTCAAFAFSAFPPLPPPIVSSSGYQISPATHTPAEDETLNSDEAATQPWEFGGLSTDGKDETGGVPCCKHLLACVLAERWDAVLGEYMEDRLVGKEEGAGLVGDL